MNEVSPLALLAVTAALAILPLFFGMCTSYLKVNIVLGMLRNGLGTQQAPGGMVILCLSVALSLIVMGPSLQESAEEFSKRDWGAVSKRPAREIVDEVKPLIGPFLQFARRHSGQRELEAVRQLLSPGSLASMSAESLSAGAVWGAFILTELKEAFAMSFVLLLPFLVLDLIIANVLSGLGMFMVSPQMLSLPLKLLLFIAADGWLLLSRSLITSYAS